MPIEDIRKCFAAIPNWCGNVPYDYWLRLGMAAHAASGGSGEALDAWIDWSGFRDANVCRQKWRGFGGGAIGPGTLVHEARMHAPDLKLTPRHDDGATPARRDMAKLMATMRKWKEVRRKG